MPEARLLESAVSGEGPGDVLVVCQGKKGKDSLASLTTPWIRLERTAISSVPASRVRLSNQQVNELRLINQRLAKQCAYDSVQQAVFDAGNNDRIVVLPGLYTEPRSRSAPENDPTCVPSLLQE